MRLMAAALVLSALGGCASRGMTILNSAEPQDGESGWIVLSSDVDTSDSAHSAGLFSVVSGAKLYFSSERKDSCGDLFLDVTPSHVATNDFVYSNDDNGNLYVARLPKGRYAICAYTLTRGNLVWKGAFTPDQTFTVVPGKTLYLGSRVFFVVDRELYVKTMNAFDRDMNQFELRMSPLKRSDVLNPLPPQVPILAAPPTR